MTWLIQVILAEQLFWFFNFDLIDWSYWIMVDHETNGLLANAITDGGSARLKLVGAVLKTLMIIKKNLVYICQFFLSS